MRYLMQNFFYGVLAFCATTAFITKPIAHAEVQASITVVDPAGQPVSNARILIGPAANDPFVGNSVTTNAAGEATIPAQWRTPLALTIEKPGHVRSSFFNVEPKAQRFTLTYTEGAQKIKVSGKSKDFGRLRPDGKVDFSLVIPTFRRADILRFDLGQVVSPEGDRVDVGVAQFDLPSNVTLPKQTESYIVPINLEKEVYRTFVRAPGNYQFTATHGQFPLRQVVNAFREGKSLFEIANYFDFIQSGSVEVAVNGETVSDIAVNQKVFNQTFSLTAPTLGPELVMVGLGLQLENDRLYPTDLKTFKSGETKNLKTIGTPDQQHVLALMTENLKKPEPSGSEGIGTPTVIEPLSITKLLQDDLFSTDTPETSGQDNLGQFDLNKMSFALLKVGGPAPAFIGFAAPPVVEGNSLALTPPAPVPGILSIATLVIYSEVEVTEVDRVVSEKRTRLWELTTQGWANRISLPSVPQINDTSKKYRWEVLFLGQLEGKTPGSISDLSAVTHVSRSQLDL